MYFIDIIMPDRHDLVRIAYRDMPKRGIQVAEANACEHNPLSNVQKGLKDVSRLESRTKCIRNGIMANLCR